MEGNKKWQRLLPLNKDKVDLTSKKSNQIWELLARIYTLKAFFGQTENRKHKNKNRL